MSRSLDIRLNRIWTKLSDIELAYLRDLYQHIESFAPHDRIMITALYKARISMDVDWEQAYEEYMGKHSNE